MEDHNERPDRDNRCEQSEDNNFSGLMAGTVLAESEDPCCTSAKEVRINQLNYGYVVKIVAKQHVSKIWRKPAEARQTGRVDIDTALGRQRKDILLKDLGIIT